MAEHELTNDLIATEVMGWEHIDGFWMKFSNNAFDDFTTTDFSPHPIAENYFEPLHNYHHMRLAQERMTELGLENEYLGLLRYELTRGRSDLQDLRLAKVRRQINLLVLYATATQHCAAMLQAVRATADFRRMKSAATRAGEVGHV